MKFHGFSQNKRLKAKAEYDLYEDFKTDLKIIEQALDALEEANKRFTEDFAAWREDWRTKLGMLDISGAKDAIFAKWTDPETTAVEHEINEAGTEEDAPDEGVSNTAHIEDYTAYLNGKGSTNVRGSESPIVPQLH